MVVRFVPVEEPAERPEAREEGDLAEVIDFRSRLSAARDDQADQLGHHAVEPPSKPTAAPALRAVQKSRPDVMPPTPRVVDNVVAFSLPAGAGKSVDGQTREGFAPSTRSFEHRSEAPDQPTRPTSSVHDDGVRVLAKRAISSGELTRELIRLGHDSHEIEVLIEDFRERLYLDDVSLARTLTEKLRESKGASRPHIRQKLRERQLTDTTIDTVLAELDEADDLTLLRDAAENRARKLGGLDRATAERRLLGYLARRGWSGQEVFRVVREVLDPSGSRSSVRFDV